MILLSWARLNNNQKFWSKYNSRISYLYVQKVKSKDINFKHQFMDDANKQGNVAANSKRESVSNFFNASSVLQSFWIRCRTIFPNTLDRKFMESELRFVLYCGSVLWIVYILSKVI